MYHLVSIMLLARFLPIKSVFYDHAIFSFKNHYGLNLQEMAGSPNDSNQLKLSSIIRHFTPKSVSKTQLSEENKTVEVHDSKESHDI